MTARAGTAGFTLVEMMIVLAVLAMGVVFIGPMIHRGTSARDLDDLGRRIAMAARSARDRSMRHNVETALLFDPRSRAFLTLPDQNRVSLPADVSASVSTGRELEMGGRPTIRFLPDGRSSGGGIRLKAPDATLDLSVDWLTGWVRRGPA